MKTFACAALAAVVYGQDIVSEEPHFLAEDAPTLKFTMQTDFTATYRGYKSGLFTCDADDKNCTALAKQFICMMSTDIFYKEAVNPSWTKGADEVNVKSTLGNDYTGRACWKSGENCFEATAFVASASTTQPNMVGYGPNAGATPTRSVFNAYNTSGNSAADTLFSFYRSSEGTEAATSFTFRQTIGEAEPNAAVVASLKLGEKDTTWGAKLTKFGYDGKELISESVSYTADLSLMRKQTDLYQLGSSIFVPAALATKLALEYDAATIAQAACNYTTLKPITFTFATDDNEVGFTLPAEAAFTTSGNTCTSIFVADATLSGSTTFWAGDVFYNYFTAQYNPAFSLVSFGVSQQWTDKAKVDGKVLEGAMVLNAVFAVAAAGAALLAF